MVETSFIIRELDPGRNRLLPGSPRMIRFGDGSEHRCESPRDPSEPYLRRWFFNQLIYCRVAQEIGAPVLQVQACRLGEEVFLCSEPLDWERLDKTAFQNKDTRTNVSFDGYNITAFYNCLKSETLTRVAGQFIDLLVTDQLLWMLDRTPDNVLGECGADGNYSQIVAIDHEHCLALGVAPECSQPNRVQKRCHPTQMSHLFGNVSRDDVLGRASAAQTKVSPKSLRDLAYDLAARLSEFLPGYDRSILERHAAISATLFHQLWKSLPGRMQDFFESYVPLLRCRRLHP